MATSAVALVTPPDTFAVRLAIVRAACGGWNIKRAAEECGVDPESWRMWEKGRKPQNREAICRAIEARTGYAYDWLMAGGALAPTFGYKLNAAGEPLILAIVSDTPEPVQRELFGPELCAVP